MKKLLAIILAAWMLLTLAACSEQTNTSTDSTQSGIPSMDLSAIMGGNGSTDVIYGTLDEATKQQLIAEAQAEGVEITFGADGSMTVVDTDGTVIVQNPDGTWVIRDSDGGQAQLGGNWPDNEFTRLLPRPDFAVFATGIDGDCFTAVFNSTTAQDAKDYADALRAAGFILSETVEEDTAWGYYCFTACHAQGYQVELSWASGTLSLLVSLDDGTMDDPAGPTDPATPENPAFAALPEIPFSHESMGAMDNYIAFVSYTATVAEVRAYVQTLRDAGFTLREELTDEEYMGYAIYSFMAYNEEGTLVMISSTSGYTTISFTLDTDPGTGSSSGWPEGLPEYPYGIETDLNDGAIAVYGTTLEEMAAYIDLLKGHGFVFDDFYDSGMTEEAMLASLDHWNGTNGTLYIEIGYGYGDLGLGYGETGTITIIYTYERPSIDDIW